MAYDRFSNSAIDTTPTPLQPAGGFGSTKPLGIGSPSATGAPPPSGTIDYTQFANMTPGQVYAANPNGLPAGWDWSKYQSAQAKGSKFGTGVDLSWTDAAGNPISQAPWMPKNVTDPFGYAIPGGTGTSPPPAAGAPPPPAGTPVSSGAAPVGTGQGRAKSGTVGNASTPAPGSHPTLNSAGQWVDPGPAPGTPWQGYGSFGYAIEYGPPNQDESGRDVYSPDFQAAINAGWTTPNGQMTPAALAALGKAPNGQQYYQTNPQRAIDPSKVVWNDTFGWVTTSDNIRTASDPALQSVIPAATLAAIGWGAGSAFGLTGSAPWETGGAGAPTVNVPGPLNAGDYTIPPADTTLGAAPAIGGGAAVPSVSVPGPLDAGSYTIPPANPALSSPPPIFVPGASVNVPPNMNASDYTTPAANPSLTAPPALNATASIADRFTSYINNHIPQILGSAITTGATLAAGNRASNNANNAVNRVANTVNNTANALGPVATSTLQNNGQPTSQQMQTINDIIDQQDKQGSEAIIQASINSGQGGAESMVVQDKIRSFRQQLAVQKETMILNQSAQNMAYALKELGLITDSEFNLAMLELSQSQQSQQQTQSILSSLGWIWAQSTNSTNSGT